LRANPRRLAPARDRRALNFASVSGERSRTALIRTARRAALRTHVHFARSTEPAGERKSKRRRKSFRSSRSDFGGSSSVSSSTSSVASI
jgi:hypothetical protein